MAAGSLPTADHERWFIVQRWQAYSGESRANLLRIVAIGAFYLVHLWSYFSAQGWLPNFGFLQLAGSGEINRQFHVVVTLLAAAWAMLALGIQLALQQRMFPRWLPFFSTLCDVVMLTCIASVASGPRSPLVAGYFLILILAALRMSLPLVRFATAACALGYVCLLGCAKWPASFGLDKLGVVPEAYHVPRYQQLVMLVAIGLAGVMLGQLVRSVERLVIEANTGKPSA